MWYTTNLRLATWLALNNVWPTSYEKPEVGDHYRMCYPSKPAILDKYPSDPEALKFTRIINTYHQLREALQTKREMDREAAELAAKAA